MIIADIKYETVTSTTTSYKISGEQLIALFNRLGFQIPETAYVSVQIPGSSKLTISTYVPIEIQYTIKK